MWIGCFLLDGFGIVVVWMWCDMIGDLWYVDWVLCGIYCVLCIGVGFFGNVGGRGIYYCIEWCVVGGLGGGLLLGYVG